MSELTQALNKVVEIGDNQNSISFTGQAVSVMQDCSGRLDYKSYNQAIKTLEEAAASGRGSEKAQLLKRWVLLLKELERLSADSSYYKEKTLEQQRYASAEKKKSSKNRALAPYCDFDEEGELMNFCNIFIHIQVLEGKITTDSDNLGVHAQKVDKLKVSGAPLPNLSVNDEICISDMRLQREETPKFCVPEEIEVAEIEKLQEIVAEITGLEVKRGEVEASLKKVNIFLTAAYERLQRAKEEVDQFDEAIEKIVIPHLNRKITITPGLFDSMREYLRAQKVEFSSEENLGVHAQKVDKLKVSGDPLPNLSVNDEICISDTRFQREETPKFCVPEGIEVAEIEELQEIVAEITGLEAKRGELEASLKKVNISLTAAYERLQRTIEEVDQFDEVIEKIVIPHLNRKMTITPGLLDSMREYLRTQKVVFSREEYQSIEIVKSHMESYELEEEYNADVTGNSESSGRWLFFAELDGGTWAYQPPEDYMFEIFKKAGMCVDYFS